VRKTLGGDAIVGAFCGVSRHDGLNAGEAGADYVAFGPVGTSALGDGRVADPEIFSWWFEVVEVPVVAEGALSRDVIAGLASFTDFFAIGDEIWRTDDAVAELSQLIQAMG
jgi:thiamine-phosphate pyrophosphorylase